MGPNVKSEVILPLGLILLSELPMASRLLRCIERVFSTADHRVSANQIAEIEKPVASVIIEKTPTLGRYSPVLCFEGARRDFDHGLTATALKLIPAISATTVLLCLVLPVKGAEYDGDFDSTSPT